MSCQADEIRGLRDEPQWTRNKHSDQGRLHQYCGRRIILKILYFDCFSGISGDMCLGALLDLGIDSEVFKGELDKLHLEGYEIVVERTNRKGISGTDVNIIVEERTPKHNEPADDHDHGSGPVHAHHHLEGAGAEHFHERTHHHDARNLMDIEKLIDASGLSEKVKEFSKTVFHEIARAEAKVHGKPLQEVHFHEVGAVDSIVDIVGTAICLDLIGAEKVFASHLHDGSGFVECQHGVIPVPVPAVMEMLSGSGIVVESESVKTELITPTGMGLIKCLAQEFGNMPKMRIDKVGYGFGKRETGRLNALRIVQGTLIEPV
jgi:uncharacterized protein (TIGR00299 family) protein